MKKKYLYIIILAAVMVSAFFLRSYNLHDWLYFEADQARNANNSIDVLNEGFSQLPLLGPKAGGTDFHLGPISYYFEYLSAVIFNSISPEVFAYSNLFFLLLLIPLSYYFLKQFFSSEISLLVTIVFSFSYLITQYSRFSWNPNSMIFWSLLTVLCIFKSTESNNKSKWWLLGLGLGYGIASQLHTTALLGLPLVAILFWLFYRPRGINWKYWAAAALIVVLLYSPVIFFDLKNKGYNSKQFLKAFNVKSEKRGLAESFEKNLELHGKYYSFILFSVHDKEFEKSAWIGWGLVSVAMLVVLFMMIRVIKIKKQPPLTRKFFIFLLVWFGVYFLVYLKLAFEIDQVRFWFPVVAVPYVFFSNYFYLAVG
jgi:4-amino-4-deoxy-L-arabinose transferase-like glycosyltransferase